MRLKDVVDINSSTLPENTSNSYCFKYIDISSISSDGIISFGEEIAFCDAPSRARRIIKQGDILVSTVRTYLRAIAPINFDVKDIIASTGFAVCTPKKNLSSKYLAYTIRNNCVIDEICKESTGVSYPAITASRLSSINIPYTDIEEQQAIADYLDEKTAEIDKQVELLDQKQKAYQKLKASLINQVVTRGLNPNAPLRDSEIDWIGEIPAHWEVKRLKDVTSFYTGNSLNESEKEYYGECNDVNSYPYIGSKDVERGISRINYDSGYRIPHNEPKFAIAHVGDTLICIEGGSAGKKFGFVEQDVCFVNKLCCAKTILQDKFSFYYFNSYIFANQFNQQLQGMIGGVSINKIKVMSIAVPPIEEQQAIADYLDEKTAEIDNTITNIDKKIKAYKRLKQSLIDEVVTGKRKI